MPTSPGTLGVASGAPHSGHKVPDGFVWSVVITAGSMETSSSRQFQSADFDDFNPMDLDNREVIMAA